MSKLIPNSKEGGIQPTPEREHAIEMIIGRLLQLCVIATVLVVVVGIGLWLPNARSSRTDYGTFIGEPEALRNVGGILRSASRGEGLAIIQAGLLLLILTPILRVLFSVFAFLNEKDYLYVGLTVVVLGLLLFSLSGG